MNIVGFCRRNRYAVFLLTAILTAAGLYSLFHLPSNIYPELNFPRVVILAHSADLPPETMLLNVTRPLEQAASTVMGVQRVRSKTIRGSTEISLLFGSGTDMQYALQLVQARVNEAQRELPLETQVQVERLTPVVFPVLSYVLNGNVPGTDLRDNAYYVLRPMFSRVPGVGQVEVQASATREVSVLVDPGKLVAHRLSLVDVADRLRATNELTQVGRLPKDYKQYLVLTTGQFTTLEDVRNAVIAVEGRTPLRLRDIADVRDGVADPQTLISGNGQPAALINISRQLGGDLVGMTDQIKQLAANLGPAIPARLRLSLVYDLAEFVKNAIGNVRDAILIGAALAVLILGLFLRDGRTTFVAATALPLSVIGTFFFLKLFGGNLNLMSLGGLAIGIGIIIDDAVVAIENIYRHLGMGATPAAAAETGVQELLGPVVGSTATTLVVFLPLGLLQGVVGEFFSALCLTLSISVLLSLAFALTIVPLLAERYLTPRVQHMSSERFIAPVNRVYEKLVRWALGRAAWVAALALLLVVLGGFLYTRLETGFLPEMDEGGYVLDYWMPPGTSLQETDRAMREIEQRIAAMPETASFSRRTGAEMGLFATEQNRGDVLVKLKPRSQRKRSANEVIEDLRAQMDRDFPGVVVEFVQLLQDMIGDLEGSPEPIEVKLFGSSMAELERLADVIGPKIEKIPGVVDFRGLQKGNPQVIFHVDAAQAARAELTVDQVSQQISAGLLGLTQTSLRQSDRTIGIRVRLPDRFRYDYAELRNFPVVTPDKHVMPLASLAQVEQVQGESSLQRENQRLMVTLTARLENRDLGSAIRDVRRVMAGEILPVGTTYEIGGQYESQQNSFRALLGVLVLSLAAVLTVLVVQFRKFRPALIILSAASLSLVGVFLMLLVTGTPLNVSSFMGIILMVGLVVKNGIILFDYVQKLHEEAGMPLLDALATAGRIRVRPILMTTLATLFGLLPLALGLGSGAELQKPLALAVIGGLSLSTLITLVIMPALYALTERRAG